MPSTAKFRSWIAVLGLAAMGGAACAGQPVIPYQTKALVTSLRGEDTGSVFGTTVLYLNPADRRAYVARVRDGLLVDARGEPIETNNTNAIFVMTGDGTLYVHTKPEVGVFHHSTFVAGGPVAAAGELEIHRGVLVLVSDKSGHYRPNGRLTAQVLHHLRCRGVDLSKVALWQELRGSSTAEKLLASEEKAATLGACH